MWFLSSASTACAKLKETSPFSTGACVGRGAVATHWRIHLSTPCNKVFGTLVLEALSGRTLCASVWKQPALAYRDGKDLVSMGKRQSPYVPFAAASEVDIVVLTFSEVQYMLSLLSLLSGCLSILPLMSLFSASHHHLFGFSSLSLLAVFLFLTEISVGHLGWHGWVHGVAVLKK